MPIIREKLRSIGQNLSLKLNFNSNDDFIGSQQEINDLTEFSALDVVNPVIDVEERKFKLNPLVGTSTISFYFYNPNGITSNNNSIPAEIYYNPALINSLKANNASGQIFSITFKYTIDASCDNSGTNGQDPTQATSNFNISTNGGISFITIDSVYASVSGGNYPNSQSDSQTKTSTYVINGVTDVTQIVVGGGIDCDMGLNGKSGGVTVIIDSATSNSGLVKIICNNTYSYNCSGENSSCGGISSTPTILSYDTSFINAGFSQAEIDGNSVTMLNSFFILDFYDTYDINTQVKLFTTYLTKIGNKSQYVINASTKNQLYDLYIPVSFIESQINNIVNGYAKFTFYNAKNGKTTLFYNQDNISIGTSEKMYFKINLDLINKTWKVIGASSPNMNANQLVNSTQYNNRIDNTIINTNNIKQIFPLGNKYQSNENSYTVI